MEGGGAAGSMNGGPLPGTSGRSPGDPGKKRGRSKKASATVTSGAAAAAAGAAPPYRNGGPKGGPAGMYDMGPDSPGRPRHLSGFPYDLKGQPVPTPLYQDFGGGRLSPPRMDNGFGGPGGGPPYPGHPHPQAEGAWPPPEYQTIVPDQYFPGE